MLLTGEAEGRELIAGAADAKDVVRVACCTDWPMGVRAVEAKETPSRAGGLLDLCFTERKAGETFGESLRPTTVNGGSARAVRGAGSHVWIGDGGVEEPAPMLCDTANAACEGDDAEH